MTSTQESDFTKFNKQYTHALAGKPYKILDLYESGISIVKTNDSFAIRESVLSKLLVLFPSNVQLLYYMGHIHLTKSTTKALMWFRQCLDRQPGNVECLLDYLKILFDNDMFDAIAQYNENNNGILYKINDNRIRLILAAHEGKRRNFEKSIQQYLKIIASGETDPTTLFMCYSNTGITYNDIDNRVDSVGYLQTAISMIKTHGINNIPVCKNAFSNLFISSDYEYLSPAAMAAQHKAYNEFVPKSKNFTFPSKPKNGEKIRIGYVSGDFDTHVVSQFIVPILLNHTDAFEVHCFSNMAFANPHFADSVGDRAISHHIKTLSDAELATYINNLDIHILIDLSGHTAKNRLEMFARNPAPVQMTYLGFPNSTGLDSIHYRITDAIADHPESNQRFSEKLINMPRCFLLFADLYKLEIPVKPVQSGKIVLGAINRESKNSTYVIGAWRKILAECPDTSILIKLSGRDNEESRTKYYMDTLGITRDRLITVGVLPTEAEFIKIYSKIDILLDTFPYSGTTTSCKSLFYSVPIVTKYHKDYHVNNVTASLLIGSGCPELVAYSDEEYVTKTIELIRDPDRISRYKKDIKPRFSELMEPGAFMESYETLLKSTLI
jgi:protein O-GlcNAc transferase